MSCTHSIIIAYETQEIHHGVTEGTEVDGNALRAELLLRGPNEPVKFAVVRADQRATIWVRKPDTSLRLCQSPATQLSSIWSMSADSSIAPPIGVTKYQK